FARKKNFLRNYRYSEEDILRKERRVKYLKERMENLTGVRSSILSDMPKGGLAKEFTDYVDEYLDEVKILLNNIRRKKILTNKVEEAIENLGDYEHKEVLKLIYYDRYTISMVAEKLFLSERTIKRRHKEAIKLLDL
ncbi:DUF1492 domain-containing protein, partial [Peptostreptococcaceae bacterium OttesenSCG-928-C18]|nr:DUF1492 domain-containing protein [Peptostreptococcaceae bacterium OttesenSCG-928-C18]